MSLSGSQSPEDVMHGSWVEMEGTSAMIGCSESLTGPQGTASSLLQGELEMILLEAQLESDRYSHTDSPPPQVTPRSAGSPRPASEGSSSIDCITIQSEEGERRISAEEFVFQRPKQTSSLSVRKSEVMKRGLFSSDVPLVLIPSLVASHLLTLGLGIYIGKRLAASSTSTL
ncbi:hypothetical protein COCON_G00165020 [Conger conger]|uniref:BCL2/adenovirus E1B 19 kDa protein-interacting protein 3-like n=1 Tax=Conger conger TaxID=82655 RepID=A0A9Q1HT54_CONCO|nr:hypothetical protein COCON_G00165020 [Conger conger]